MPRIAWFTPLPPVRSGIAQYNRELLPSLAHVHQIDLFVDGRPEDASAPDAETHVFSAFDFVWRERERHDRRLSARQRPLPRLHVGLSRQVSGLTVLHDGNCHARGRMLLQQWPPRQDNYRHEFWFNHPTREKGIAELGAVGPLGSLTYLWPMLRGVIESAAICSCTLNGLPATFASAIRAQPSRLWRWACRHRHARRCPAADSNAAWYPGRRDPLHGVRKITPESACGKPFGRCPRSSSTLPMFTCCLPERPSNTDMAREASRAESTSGSPSRVCSTTARWTTISPPLTCACACGGRRRARPRVVASLPGRRQTDDIHGPGPHRRPPGIRSRSWTIQTGTAPVGVSIDILDEARS
jgi:hypothetical protein